MAKVTAPLLSLEAHGRIGPGLQYSGRGATARATAPTTHPGTYSPRQVRQRWLYRVGCGLWVGMAPADRLPWQIAAEVQATTPMALWLRHWFATLPNLLAAIVPWQGSGATFQDIGPVPQAWTLTGPTWLPLPTSSALSFDGANDRLAAPNTSYLGLQLPGYTLLWHARPQNMAGLPRLISKRLEASFGWSLGHQADGAHHFTRHGSWGATVDYSPAGAVVNGQPYTAALTMDNGTLTWFKNALQ